MSSSFLIALSAALFCFHCVHCAEPIIARQNYGNYQQQQEQQYSGSTYNVVSGQLSLAQALPITSQQLTLKQIYGQQANIRFMLNFPQEPNRWDPYNMASEFMWRARNPGAGIPADNAYIELPNSGPYAKPYATGKAALISAPFQTWIPLNDSMDTNNIVTPANEGGLEWKSNVTINSMLRIVYRIQTSCKIINAEKHPFPANLVTRPDDDPRLANCNFQLQPRDDNATSLIGVAITNKSVWALFYGAFGLAKKRIGIRRTYNDIVDVALEYNAMTSQYIFYISGQPVWQVADSLQPPPQDGSVKLDLNDPIPADVTFPPRPNPIFGFAFGTHKCLDESDPWNQASTTRLVRELGYDGIYGNNTVFYDNDNLRSNNLWGQTVKMTLYKAIVETTSAVVSTQAQLPNIYNSGGGGGGSSNGGYGGSSPVDQQQQPYASSAPLPSSASSYSASTTYENNNDDDNNSYGVDNTASDYE